MSTKLCISIRFVDPTPMFHGKRDGQDAEWPPSPMRLLLTLINAATNVSSTDQLLDDYLRTLTRLSQLDCPLIIASECIIGKQYSTSVPNNDIDILFNSYRTGATPAKTVAELKSLKYYQPVYMLNSDEAMVHYIYEIDDAAIKDFSNLNEFSDYVTHLGLGIDMACCSVQFLNDIQVGQLQGIKWVPVQGDRDIQGGTFLRVPIKSTVDDACRRHTAFKGRLFNGDFRPVPPLTEYRTVGYRRAIDLPARPVISLSLLQPDASGYRPFNPLNLMKVAGMVRHACAQSAAGMAWAPERINQLILGHGDAKNGQASSDDRLMFLPVPSITPLKVESIRRVLVTLPYGMRPNQLIPLLNGQELIDEESGETVAMLSLVPNSEPMLKFNYLNPGSVWSTVTPVLLPGYDDPRQLRQKLTDNRDPEKQKSYLRQLDQRVLELIVKAFVQAGFHRDLIDETVIEYRPGGFRPGVDMASRYLKPENLKKFPAYHVRVIFPTNVPGPICIGAGRYRGFGLFAQEYPKQEQSKN